MADKEKYSVEYIDKLTDILAKKHIEVFEIPGKLKIERESKEILREENAQKDKVSRTADRMKIGM